MLKGPPFATVTFDAELDATDQRYERKRTTMITFSGPPKVMKGAIIGLDPFQAGGKYYHLPLQPDHTAAQARLKRERSGGTDE